MADHVENFAVNSARWLSLEDFEGEVWKDIPNYEGWYQASNLGRIKSVCRYVNNKRIRERILKFSKWSKYFRVKFSINGVTKDFSVHHVIAETFIANPYNLSEIDHINTNKLDNRAINLMWVTHFANMNNSITRKIISKQVELLSNDGTILATFPTIVSAIKTIGINKKSLYEILNHKKYKYQTKWRNLYIRYKQ